jgi:hypothetical protein
MDLIDRLISIIEPTIDAMGYELVRVQIQGNRRQTLPFPLFWMWKIRSQGRTIWKSVRRGSTVR